MKEVNIKGEKTLYQFDITNKDIIYNISENSKLIVYQYGIEIGRAHV